MLDASFETLQRGSRVIRPTWPAAAGVFAAVTTRHGGASRGAFAGLNLGNHVGDDPAAVSANRESLRQALALPAEPVWLQQVHGTRVVEAETASAGEEADAAVAFAAGRVCAVLTADCLPVLFSDRAGTRVAVAHAGWRGLADGVLEAAVKALDTAPSELLAWLGPAIGPQAFEVGPEVREVFMSADAGSDACFAPSPRADHFMADLYALARRRLRACGISDISGGGACTFSDAGNFYSYRRDGECGRMASLIWLG